jgi:hypothetical protein
VRSQWAAIPLEASEAALLPPPAPGGSGVPQFEAVFLQPLPAFT